MVVVVVVLLKGVENQVSGKMCAGLRAKVKQARLEAGEVATLGCEDLTQHPAVS